MVASSPERRKIMFRVGKDFRLTSSDEGLVILDLKSGKYMRLNRSGKTVLESLLENGTTEACVSRLSQQFPTASVNTIQKDVELLTSELLAQRVIDRI